LVIGETPFKNEEMKRNEGYPPVGAGATGSRA
jgi:hypothetical protein